MQAETEAEAVEEAPAAEFSYSGDTGPSHWGSLSPDYAACSDGTEQSPIDLTAGTQGKPPALEVNYGSSPLRLENNGHSVEATVPEGSSVTLDGNEYPLGQFHYHAPSEHTLDRESMPLELHFVNQTEDGAAVLGVLVREGKANPAYDALIKALPATEGETAEVEATDLSSLLPDDPGGAERWSYDGSLTTPPCTEGVAWAVFAEPIEMSTEQIAAFTDIYDHTNRPVQPLGDRELVVGS